MPVKVDTSACVGCGACTSVCPVSALEVKDGVCTVNADACVECGSCTGTCPVGALSL